MAMSGTPGSSRGPPGSSTELHTFYNDEEDDQVSPDMPLNPPGRSAQQPRPRTGLRRSFRSSSQQPMPLQLPQQYGLAQGEPPQAGQLRGDPSLRGSGDSLRSGTESPVWGSQGQRPNIIPAQAPPQPRPQGPGRTTTQGLDTQPPPSAKQLGKRPQTVPLDETVASGSGVAPIDHTQELPPDVQPESSGRTPRPPRSVPPSSGRQSSEPSVEDIASQFLQGYAPVLMRDGRLPVPPTYNGSPFAAPSHIPPVGMPPPIGREAVRIAQWLAQGQLPPAPEGFNSEQKKEWITWVGQLGYWERQWETQWMADRRQNENQDFTQGLQWAIHEDRERRADRRLNKALGIGGAFTLTAAGMNGAFRGLVPARSSGGSGEGSSPAGVVKREPYVGGGSVLGRRFNTDYPTRRFNNGTNSTNSTGYPDDYLQHMKPDGTPPESTTFSEKTYKNEFANLHNEIDSRDKGQIIQVDHKPPVSRPTTVA